MAANMHYNRRQGLAWQNDLYSKLLQAIINENVVIDKNTHETITGQQLLNLSKAVFPTYSQRRTYKDKIRFFLQCYFAAVTADVLKLKSGMKVINAPELQEWLEYKDKLGKSMCQRSIRESIQNFLTSVDYKLSADTRKKIVSDIYNIEEQNIELWMMKKLHNHLWFNRTEICDETESAILRCTANNNNERENNFFCGFDKEEMTIAMNGQCAIDFLIVSESKAVTSKVLVERNNVNRSNIVSKSGSNFISNTSQNKITKPKTSNIKSRNASQKIQRQSIALYDSISQPALEFFRQADTNDQLQLLKKIVILNVVAPNNHNLKKYMVGSGRIARSTKKTILECIHQENIKESHYSLLDLLTLKRYLIKEKTGEVIHLLKMRNIDILKEIKGMSNFCDVESKFYEVLQEISSEDSTELV